MIVNGYPVPAAITVKLIDQPAPNEYKIPYKVSGNTLTITDAAGNAVVYTRV